MAILKQGEKRTEAAQAENETNQPEALLREAIEDIEYLRRKNELMAAKLEGIEIMAMAVASQNRHGLTGEGMKVDVVYKIRNYLNKKSA